MPVYIVNSAEEFQKVLQSHEKVVCDFWATWCGPCKKIAPYLEDLSDKYPNILFIKVDVDTVADLADSENVTAMPTFKCYMKGSALGTVTGANPAVLASMVDNLASSE